MHLGLKQLQFAVVKQVLVNLMNMVKPVKFAVLLVMPMVRPVVKQVVSWLCQVA